MKNIVLLLRGINVGGNNILPMAKLRDLLSSLGAKHVKTYIQSGNAVMQVATALPAFAKRISQTIDEKFGFVPSLIVLPENDFESILIENPFTQRALHGKFLHTSILQRPASKANLARIGELAANGEEFALTDKAFYLHAPNGIGRSKLAAEIEKHLGVSCTARNANTMTKLSALLKELP